MNELLTTKEVLETLRISRHTLWKQMQPGGDLKKLKRRRIGSRVFYVRSSVEKFLKGE